MLEYMLVAGALIGLLLTQLKLPVKERMKKVMEKAQAQLISPSATADAIIPSLGK